MTLPPFCRNFNNNLLVTYMYNNHRRKRLFRIKYKSRNYILGYLLLTSNRNTFYVSEEYLAIIAVQ